MPPQPGSLYPWCRLFSSPAGKRPQDEKDEAYDYDDGNYTHPYTGTEDVGDQLTTGDGRCDQGEDYQKRKRKWLVHGNGFLLVMNVLLT
jgi:hypothetical protein